MIDLDPHAARLDVRIGEHLREIVDRARGHAGLLQFVQPVGHRLLQEQAGEDRHDLLAVHDAVVVLEESWIGRELGRPEHGAGALELAVIADHQHQLAVGAAEHAGRHAAIAPGAAPRRGLAVDEIDLQPNATARRSRCRTGRRRHAAPPRHWPCGDRARTGCRSMCSCRSCSRRWRGRPSSVPRRARRRYGR